MHHMDANKTHREKAWWELHKKDTSYLQQILEIKSTETTATYLPSHKTSK